MNFKTIVFGLIAVFASCAVADAGVRSRSVVRTRSVAPAAVRVQTLNVVPHAALVPGVVAPVGVRALPTVRFNTFGTRTVVDAFGNVFEADAFGNTVLRGNRGGFNAFGGAIVPVAPPIIVPGF